MTQKCLIILGMASKIKMVAQAYSQERSVRVVCTKVIRKLLVKTVLPTQSWDLSPKGSNWVGLIIQVDKDPSSDETESTGSLQPRPGVTA